MQCPVCRNQVDQGPQCRRCRADLSLLFCLEKQRVHILDVAMQCLSQRRPRRALALAEGADALRHDDQSQRLRILSILCQRDFARALQEYNARAHNSSRESTGVSGLQ